MFNLKACSGFHFLSQQIQCCQSVIRGCFNRDTYTITQLALKLNVQELPLYPNSTSTSTFCSKHLFLTHNHFVQLKNIHPCLQKLWLWESVSPRVRRHPHHLHHQVILFPLLSSTSVLHHQERAARLLPLDGVPLPHYWFRREFLWWQPDKGGVHLNKNISWKISLSKMNFPLN